MPNEPANPAMPAKSHPRIEHARYGVAALANSISDVLGDEAVANLLGSRPQIDGREPRLFELVAEILEVMERRRAVFIAVDADERDRWLQAIGSRIVIEPAGEARSGQLDADGQAAEAALWAEAALDHSFRAEMAEIARDFGGAESQPA